jgi:hypothetical protein
MSLNTLRVPTIGFHSNEIRAFGSASFRKACIERRKDGGINSGR